MKTLSLIVLFFWCSLLADATVKIGILAKRGDVKAIARWTPSAEYLSAQIEGYRFEIVPLSFEYLSKAVKKREIDFVVTNTAYYVELEALYGVSRIATLKTLSLSGVVQTRFGGVILTKAGSGIERIEGLRGKRFGAVDRQSFGGWIMAQKELKDHGIETDDLGSLRFFGSHDAVIFAIQNGEIDAGTVRSDTFERMIHEGLIIPQACRVLGIKHYEGFPYVVSTELYPEWPFAKLAHTPMKLSEAVAVALLGMQPDSEAAVASEGAGWTIPLDYSLVHTLMQELHLGPYASLREITWQSVYERYRYWMFVGIALFVLALAVVLYIVRLNRVLHVQKSEIEGFNHELEQKVGERTLALERSNTHERYLKDILKTIIDVNEILITSYSTQSVIENAMKVLSHQSHYRHVWIGLLKNGVLEAIGHFDTPPKWFDQTHYVLGESGHNVAVEGAKTALQEGRSVAVGVSGQEEGVHWMIALPLRITESKVVTGVMNVFSTNAEPFEREEIEMLEKLAADIALTLHTISQRSMLETMELEKISNYEETILAFVDLIEQRDSYTAGHTVRVAQYCRLIAQNMGIEDALIEKLEKAAILHDIGKVVTPDAILLKPGALSPLEYELIKQHAAAGYRMLSQIDMYHDLAEIIRYHHARFDGKGYPATKPFDPEAIPLLSHIMSVADAFDAMTSNRIYKPRKTVDEALEELAQMRGTQFLPDVVDAALPVLRHVVIDETTQMPKGELEERRFAYFFSDALTDLYNENYLKTVVMGRLDRSNVLWCVDLKNVSAFNRTHGWEAGNRLLSKFAQALRERFGAAMIFRYQGDKFVLLFDEEQRFQPEEIQTFPCIEKSGIAAQVYRMSVDDVL